MGVYTNEVEDYIKAMDERKNLEQKYTEEEIQAMYEAAQRQQQNGGEDEDMGFTMPSAEAAAQEDQNMVRN